MVRLCAPAGRRSCSNSSPPSHVGWLNRGFSQCSHRGRRSQAVQAPSKCRDICPKHWFKAGRKQSSICRQEAALFENKRQAGGHSKGGFAAVAKPVQTHQQYVCWRSNQCWTCRQMTTDASCMHTVSCVGPGCVARLNMHQLLASKCLSVRTGIKSSRR